VVVAGVLVVVVVVVAGVVVVVAGVVVVVAVWLLTVVFVELVVGVSDPPQAASTSAQETESNRETKTLLLIGNFSLRIQTGQDAGSTERGNGKTLPGIIHERQRKLTTQFGPNAAARSLIKKR
jgi:hypothetical protein